MSSHLTGTSSGRTNFRIVFQLSVDQEVRMISKEQSNCFLTVIVLRSIDRLTLTHMAFGKGVILISTECGENQ